MCVIVAKKCKLKTGIENWFLYKVRDRNYDPEYELSIKVTKGTEILSLTDKTTTWKEGVSSNGLMIVSSALDNHTDLDDNGQTSAGQTASTAQLEKHKLLQKAIASNSVKTATKMLSDGRFVGTSFISDGTTLNILEVYVNNKAFDREQAKIGDDELEKLSMSLQIREIMKGIGKDDYDIQMKTETKENLVVRTNIGMLLPKAGYQKSDDDLTGYNSSIARYDYTKKAIEELGPEPHPFEVLTAIKNLTKVDKDPQHNPIRPKGKPDKDGLMMYYTSTIIMLTPTGTLFVIPISSDVEEDSKLRLKKDRKTHFVLLPKSLPLFESTSSFMIDYFDRKYSELLFNEELYKVSKMSLREKLIFESNESN